MTVLLYTWFSYSARNPGIVSDSPWMDLLQRFCREAWDWLSTYHIINRPPDLCSVYGTVC